MMGTELAAMAKGIMASRRLTKRAVMKAMRIPTAVPITNPPTALRVVKKMRGAITGHSLISEATMLLGRGSKNCWMLNSRTSSSQRANTATATTIVGR